MTQLRTEGVSMDNRELQIKDLIPFTHAMVNAGVRVPYDDDIFND